MDARTELRGVCREIHARIRDGVDVGAPAEIPGYIQTLVERVGELATQAGYAEPPIKMMLYPRYTIVQVWLYGSDLPHGIKVKDEPVPLVWWRKIAASMRTWVRGLETANPPTSPQVNDAILLNADGCYTVDGEPMAVSDNEDSVLQAFLRAPAMDNAALIKESGVELAGRVLRNLAKKYDGKLAPYITLPGGKGQGGYAVRIRRAQ